MFNVKDSHVYKVDEEKTIELSSSPDVKGIVGGDRRKYILDIMRLTPRDLNWRDEGNEENYNCCLFRLGLIKNYLMSRRVRLIQEIKESFNEEIESNKKETLTLV